MILNIQLRYGLQMFAITGTTVRHHRNTQKNILARPAELFDE